MAIDLFGVENNHQMNRFKTICILFDCELE